LAGWKSYDDVGAGAAAPTSWCAGPATGARRIAAWTAWFWVDAPAPGGRVDDTAGHQKDELIIAMQSELGEHVTVRAWRIKVPRS